MTEKKYSMKDVVEFVNMAIGDRAAIYYFMFKVLKEKGLDYRNIMEEIIRKFAESSFNAIEGVTGQINNFKDFMKLFTEFYDDVTNCAFGIEIKKFNEHESIVTQTDCPLVTKWKQMGAQKDEIKELCDIANILDFRIAEHYGCAKLKFNKLIGHGDDSCELAYTKSK